MLSYFQNLSFKKIIGICFLMVVLTALLLLWMGRVPYCTCGYILLWHGQVFSSENSQHVTDWYTFTHVLHGFMYYFFIWIVDRKKRLSLGTKLFLTLLLACGWEILENSNFIIERYRAVTISLDYFGDSVINSVFDVIAAAVSFFMAAKMRWQISLAFFIMIEVFLAYFIHDNLSLNILMLVYPIEAIKTWGVTAPIR